MAAYETKVSLDQFLGIDESRGGHNVNLSYALQAQNCLTEKGILRPSVGFAPVFPSLPEPIVSLATFYRRNHETEIDRRVLVAATETGLYCITDAMSQWKTLQTGLDGGGHWSWVTYEEVVTPNEGEPYTDDVLIMSNAVDGMYVVSGGTLTARSQQIDIIGLDEDLEVTHRYVKFGKIERHAERIWGCGIEDEPDNLYYSRPFNPYDFNLVYMTDDGTGTTTIPNGNEVLPEESGGIIQVPTWDGDKFVALKRFSNYLIAMKERSVFYIRGVAAGEFAQYEAYGSDGLFAPNALSVDTAVAYYISDGGLGVYDGDSARLLDMDKLGSVFKNMGKIYAQTACTAVCRHVLYVSVPVYTGEMTSETVGGMVRTVPQEPTQNNVLVEYDTRRGTYMVRSGISAYTLLSHGGRLLFAMGDNPSQVYEMKGTTYNGQPIPVKWVSAWQDLGAKNVTKSAFVAYVTGLEGDGQQTVNIGIETEKRLKSKPVVIGGRKKKKVRFALGNSGRLFRLVVEAQSTTDWSLSGGIQIEMELDAD